MDLEKNSFATSVTVTCFLCTSFFQDNGLNCQFVISYDSIECNVIVILDIQCNVLQTNKNRAPSYQLVFVLEITVSVLGVNLLDRVVGHRRDGAHGDQILVARP